MKIKDNKNEQLEKAQNILKGIRPNVSADDRRSAKECLSVGDFTIYKYLNGEGKNIDTALSLIKFFSTRISQREKAISKIAS